MIAVDFCRHGMELAAAVGTKHGEQRIARGLAVEMCIDEDLPSIIHCIAVKDVVLGRLTKARKSDLLSSDNVSSKIPCTA